VSHDAEELVEMLDNISHEVDIENPEFVLQEFKKGPTLSTELWFQNGEFIEPLTNHTFERKELMNGDLGPSGGCTGNIVWFCEDCPVCQAVRGLVPWFEKEKYHGMVDLNVIVAEDGIFGLEFTPRFGYDASPTLFWELINHPLGEFFADAAHGQLDELDLVEGYASAVRITIPPWPSEKYHASENVPIRGIKESDDHVFFYNVKKNDRGLCSAGAWGILSLHTGIGDTVKEAFEKPYKQVEKVRVKDKQYRTDLVEQFDKDLKQMDEILSASKVTK
jgi:phosphoribosylamine--glycine ligase